MVEFEYNDRIYLINTNNVCYVSLGDAPMPYMRSLNVCIKFNNGCLDIQTCSNDEANELYKRIKELLKK